MSLSIERIALIETAIRESLRGKFKNYKPESNHMPFHHRLLGKDRMALYSFIHSLNTNFGAAIYEPVAAALAETRFVKAQPQFVAGNQISEAAQNEIQDIINDLTMGKEADKESEIERIRTVCQQGKMKKMKTVKIDLLIEDQTGSIFLFDLKTVKPNISNFKDFKRTLLEWCAIMLAKNANLDIHSYIAIPYNPYEPKPYERWTLKGMLDLKEEVKVAEEFWNFLGGDDTYTVLLDCFERVGIELRPEIDRYFSRFAKS